MAEQDLGISLLGSIGLISKSVNCKSSHWKVSNPEATRGSNLWASLIHRVFGTNQNFLCVFVQVVAYNLHLILSVSSNRSTRKSNIQSWQQLNYQMNTVFFWFPTFPNHWVHRLIRLLGFIVQTDLLTTRHFLNLICHHLGSNISQRSQRHLTPHKRLQRASSKTWLVAWSGIPARFHLRLGFLMVATNRNPYEFSQYTINRFKF